MATITYRLSTGEQAICEVSDLVALVELAARHVGGQHELARRLEVSRQSLHNWTSCKNLCNMRYLRKMHKICAFSFEKAA